MEKVNPIAWMSIIVKKDPIFGDVQIPDLHLTKPPEHIYDKIIPLYSKLND